MVFSHIANKLGIWDIVAPVKMSGNENDNDNHSSSSFSSPDMKRRRIDQEKQNEQLSRNKVQKEDDERYRRLKSQFEIEQRAEKVNQYVKKQRVLYYSKLEDKWIDAIVVGVHFDDGPDRPYYVSLFMKSL